jgi:hypothetical protein
VLPWLSVCDKNEGQKSKDDGKRCWAIKVAYLSVSSMPVRWMTFFLLLFLWDGAESNPCYWWALRYQIYQCRQSMSGGRQISFPYSPWNLARRRKIGIGEWEPWDLSYSAYNCHAWMTACKKAIKLFTSRHQSTNPATNQRKINLRSFFHGGIWKTFSLEKSRSLKPRFMQTGKRYHSFSQSYVLLSLDWRFSIDPRVM